LHQEQGKNYLEYLKKNEKMKQTFEEKVQIVVGNYLLDNGYKKMEGKLYFFKKENSIQTNFFIEELPDENAEDEQQRFEINIGINTDDINAYMNPLAEEHPEGYANFAFNRVSDSPKFLPSLLEFKSDSNLDDLKEKITNYLAPMITAIAAFKTNNDTLDFIIDYNFYGRIDAYLIRAKDSIRYEKWYRNSNAEDIKNGTITEEQIKLKVATEIRSVRKKQMDNFVPDFDFPEAWGKCCDWVDDKHFTEWMSAGFEQDETGKQTLTHFIKEENIQNRFAAFGQSSDDSIFAVWKQDDGRMPVVYLGEGGTAKIITESMEDFIDLLAINYRDVESADITTEPIYDDAKTKEHFNNRNFRDFYTKTFKKGIATTGLAMNKRALTCDNSFEWLMTNSASFKEWNT
jgi:flavin-binding protein dodecin